MPRTVHSMLKHMITTLRISALRSAVIDKIGLKEMGTFRWEDRGKGLPCWLSQFSKTKLRQQKVQTFFPAFPKEFSQFQVPSKLRYVLTLKSLIEEQTGINEQAWKKVPPCLLIY